jgi:hypothetical protein
MNPARPAPSRGRLPWTLRMPHPVAVRDAGAACLARGQQWPQGGAGCMAAPATGPRTATGLEQSRKARWRHGRRSAESRAAARERGEARAVLIALRQLLDEA